MYLLKFGYAEITAYRYMYIHVVNNRYLPITDINHLRTSLLKRNKLDLSWGGSSVTRFTAKFTGSEIVSYNLLNYKVISSSIVAGLLLLNHL